jgi:hypothetical protein
MISNFTDTWIRLGEYPHCVDVSNIPANHSSVGVQCKLFGYCFPTNEDMARIMVIRNKIDPNVIHVLALKYSSQLNNLDSDIRDGDVIFDSFKE